MASRQKGEGTSRVVEKLRASVEDGKYYEAHQMYRTVYFRYMSQKRTNEALKLVFGGSSLLLKHEQIGSGLDLSLLFVDLMVTEKFPVNDERLDQIAHLYELFGGSHPHEKMRFMNRAIRWTISVVKEEKYGHPRLHQLAAFSCWKEGCYATSRQHFLYCDYPSEFATMLVEVSVKKGYPGEYDLFVSQAVLHLLVLQKVTNARTLFSDYVKQHPAFSSMCHPFKMPLFNFLAMLFLSIERKIVSIYNLICKLYQPSLERDPDYQYLLGRIGNSYFGLPLPSEKKGLDAMLGNLLQSFLGNDDQEGQGESAASEKDWPDDSTVDVD
ncbi:Golgi to ER traffic protein 4 homolog isoform X2 [Oscarella lobularis]|uniref:Golgi to ER traffic protein 4 homolog isoform X2 n=1 Tax=Oscarella lobularis TaxID=121494 RepID=UPI003313CDFE